MCIVDGFTLANKETGRDAATAAERTAGRQGGSGCGNRVERGEEATSAQMCRANSVTTKALAVKRRLKTSSPPPRVRGYNATERIAE
jgi:hypothetical protein